MKSKKISCVIPTYNRSEYLLYTLSELKNQTCYEDLEIIVVDDGSDDDSLGSSCLDLCDTYIKLDRNSSSVSIPRAIGITHSTCDYIAHVDDDVYNFPNKFELLLNSIEGHSAKLTYGDMEIYSNDKLCGGSYIDDWNPCLPEGWGVDGSQFIYKSDVYKNMPLVFSRRACDWATAKSIRSYFDIPFIHVPKVVSRYFWWGGNRSGDESTKTNIIKPSLFKKYFNNSDNKYIIDFEDV